MSCRQDAPGKPSPPPPLSHGCLPVPPPSRTPLGRRAGKTRAPLEVENGKLLHGRFPLACVARRKKENGKNSKRRKGKRTHFPDRPWGKERGNETGSESERAEKSRCVSFLSFSSVQFPGHPSLALAHVIFLFSAFIISFFPFWPQVTSDFSLTGTNTHTHTQAHTERPQWKNGKFFAVVVVAAAMVVARYTDIAIYIHRHTCPGTLKSAPVCVGSQPHHHTAQDNVRERDGDGGVRARRAPDAGSAAGRGGEQRIPL